jgi:hypothetical protein
MMIDALLAFLIEPPPTAWADPIVVEARYRPRRARHRHRHRKAADLDGCCWPSAEAPKVRFLGVEAFYDLFPAFRRDKE